MADERKFPRIRNFFAGTGGEGLAAGAGMAWMGGPALGLATMLGMRQVRRREQNRLDLAAEEAARGRDDFAAAFDDGFESALAFAGEGEVGAMNRAQLEQHRRTFTLGRALAGSANPDVAAQGADMMRAAYGELEPYLQDIESRSEQLFDRLDTQEFGMFRDERNAMQTTLKDAQARILERDDKFNNFAAQMETFRSGSILAQTAIAEYLGTAIEEAGGTGGALELLGLGVGAIAGPGVGARTGRAAGAILERMIGGENISNDEALRLAAALLSTQKLANNRVIDETAARLAQHDAFGVERGWLQRESFRTDQYELTPEEMRLRNQPRPETGDADAPEGPTTAADLAQLEASLPALRAEGQRDVYTIAELSDTPATQLPPSVAQVLSIAEAERGELTYNIDTRQVLDEQGREVEGLTAGMLAALHSRAIRARQRARAIAEQQGNVAERSRAVITPPPQPEARGPMRGTFDRSRPGERIRQ